MDVFAFGKRAHGEVVLLTPSLELGQIGSCAASLVTFFLLTPSKERVYKNDNSSCAWIECVSLPLCSIFYYSTLIIMLFVLLSLA